MVLPMRLKRTDIETGEEKTHLFYDGEDLVDELLHKVSEKRETINGKNYINEELLKQILMEYVRGVKK